MKAYKLMGLQRKIDGFQRQILFKIKEVLTSTGLWWGWCEFSTKSERNLIFQQIHIDPP